MAAAVPVAGTAVGSAKGPHSRQLPLAGEEVDVSGLANFLSSLARRATAIGAAVLSLAAILVLLAAPAAAADPIGLDSPKMLTDYFEQMSVAKPFVVRTGSDWEKHRRELREFVLDCAGLKPLPERVPLDVH